MTGEQLSLLSKAGVTMTMLRLMYFLKYPRRYAEIYSETGIDRSTVRKLIISYPDMIQKKSLPFDEFGRERGKPPVAIVLGPEGKKTVETLFKERVITTIT